MKDWSKSEEADKARELREETAGGDWLRLQDGESVRVVFLTPPVGYRQVWLGDHSELYDPEKHDGKRPSGRFYYSVAVAVPGAKAYKPAVFDASGEAFENIDAALTKHGAITVFELKRKGTGTKTKYACLYERALEGEELEVVSAVEPIDAQAILDAQRANEKGDGEQVTDTPQAAGDVWA